MDPEQFRQFLLNIERQRELQKRLAAQSPGPGQVLMTQGPRGPAVTLSTEGPPIDMEPPDYTKYVKPFGPQPAYTMSVVGPNRPPPKY